MIGHRCWLVDSVTRDSAKPLIRHRTTDLDTNTFKERITQDLSQAGLAQAAVNYKLRDWLFSRQRFWGEPFPILHELDEAGQPNGRLRAVDVEDLPVDLPHLDDYKPHGRPEPPLVKAPESWLYPVIDGKRYRRETNTMPQWAGSCWYYLRFIDPEERHELRRSRQRKGLDASGPVRRRSGARRPAPAVREILAQGAVRPRATSVRSSPFGVWSIRA